MTLTERDEGPEGTMYVYQMESRNLVVENPVWWVLPTAVRSQREREKF